MAKILLVDDELTMVQMVAEVLRAEGHEVFPFTNFNGVMDAISEKQPDLVITDLYLDKTKPGGMEIVRKARSMTPPPLVIMITGFGTVESAVEAMRLGAYDYLEKPFKLEELKLCVQRALSYTQAVQENTQLRRELKRRYGFSQIIGASPTMQEVFRMIERVADTDATVLILGESGTGKELVARALHYDSRRGQGPFVPVNCSALPENLLESELFGHRKGSFTGAISDKNGLFHDAHLGTIFLDEIGTMPAPLQSRLLRVLQDKEVRRVGDNQATCVDVRVVAATNEKLESLVESGRFREDLYYRLNVVTIGLPPLRDRKDDIPMLVTHFLRDKVSSRTGEPFRLSESAMNTLAKYQWPGNVRELENAVERACVLADLPLLRLRDLPPKIQALGTVRNGVPGEDEPEEKEAAIPAITGRGFSNEPSSSGSSGGTQKEGAGAASSTAVPLPALPNGVISLKRFIRDQEQAYLQQVLRLTGNSKEDAARLLDVSLATLYRKLSGEGE